MTKRKFEILILVLLTMALLGCDSKKSNSGTTETSSTQANQPSKNAQAASNVEPQGSAMHVDPTHAMQYVKEIVAFGPRWPGSKGQEKVAAYLRGKLKADHPEEDAFVADTPAGKLPMRNFIAKFQGTKDGIIVLGTHIDTLHPPQGNNFVGANDGGSSTGLLLAISDELRGKKLEGYSVWLLWDDGEESMRLPWYDPESLFGVRHLAQKWQEDGILKKVKAFILEDMIGDKDLNIDRVTECTPWLQDLALQAATRTGYQSHFFAREISAEDDYQPFLQRGVPSVDLIDFDYGYNNVFWHTTEDTLDKLNPKSLAIVGTVTLETVRLLNQR